MGPLPADEAAMGLLQQRDRAVTAVPEDVAAPPRRTGRGRRLLALGGAVVALVAFTTLARPQGSPSSRLLIGESEAADPGAGQSEAGESGGGDPETGESVGRESEGGAVSGEDESRRPRNVVRQGRLRPLDPSTLADIPANLVPIGTSDDVFPSADGALLGVPRSVGGMVGEVHVVDAQTFQPLATVALEGWPIAGFVGFSPEADALFVHRRLSGGHTLTRYPFDPSQEPTTVEVPDRLNVEQYRSAVLAGGRVALLGIERGGGNGELSTWTAHALVADLLAERLTVDVTLPDVRAEQFGDVVRSGPMYAPGLAWDAAGERLYIAHADRPRVTVVDLASGTLQAEVDLASRAPGSGDLAAGTRVKEAQLSPDGSRLYVTGRDYLLDGPGPPLGLSVINTATLTEVGYVSGVTDWVQLSPDGRWLAWTTDFFAGRNGGDPPARVVVMDTATLEQTADFEADGSAFGLGFSLDSAQYYVSSDDGGGASVVRSHALPSLLQTGERRLPADAWFEPRGGYLRELTR